MRTEEFNYDLPEELIAQTPIEPRDHSRLMIIDRDTEKIEHRRFYELPEYLEPGDLLVFNQSRVIPARLFARKPTGGKVEILLLREQTPRTWQALVGGRRVRPGMELTLLDGPDGDPIDAKAEVIARGEKSIRTITFERPALAIANEVGETPLPPYIHEPLEDAERYQTVYARRPGSAAAPTAGLHFTPDLLKTIHDQGIDSAFVTLHVGLDTFSPVHEEEIEEHEMHTEYCVLTPEVARQVNETKLRGGRVIAVGTTSVRVLETAAIAAVGGDPKAESCPWKPVVAFEGNTDLYITPGFDFRVVDALITNFHLPRSTLLMLVSAFAGKGLIDRAYQEAIDERYRFYSFGDAMLIL